MHKVSKIHQKIKGIEKVPTGQMCSKSTKTQVIHKVLPDGIHQVLPDG